MSCTDARTTGPANERPVSEPGVTEPVTSVRSVREVIAELAQTEDALREWQTRPGRRDVPVLDVRTLLHRQRELVAELRRLSGTRDLAALEAALDGQHERPGGEIAS